MLTKKSNFAKSVSAIFCAIMIMNSVCYAGVNGGTEDIIAPTAPASELQNENQVIVQEKGTSGYNQIATTQWSTRNPLDILGNPMNVGVNPNGEGGQLVPSPYQQDNPLTARMEVSSNSIAYKLPMAPSQLNEILHGSISGPIKYDSINNYKKGVTVSAPAAILVNATTKKIYFGKDEQKTYLPAGLVNLMTAYIATKNLDLDVKLKVKNSAVKGVDKEASIAALNDGDTITLRDAIGAMFVKGCVDCANVIAENVSGSINDFVDLMNSTAKEMGCLNTAFKNPSGLDEDGQSSTCYDIAIMMDKLTENEELVELLSKTEYKLPKALRRDELILYGKNTMLIKDSQVYNAGIDCSRLGYTKKAEYTIASEFTYAKNKFIIVLLKVKGTQFSDTKKLYEYAKVVYDGEQ